jgi:DNA-binding response OmpR family regulator
MMAADTEPKRVLIVEDDRDLANLYEMWLVDEYDVRIAYSGEAALERMADREADVVLLDRRIRVCPATRSQTVSTGTGATRRWS